MDLLSQVIDYGTYAGSQQISQTAHAAGSSSAVNNAHSATFQRALDGTLQSQVPDSPNFDQSRHPHQTRSTCRQHLNGQLENRRDTRRLEASFCVGELSQMMFDVVLRVCVRVCVRSCRGSSTPTTLQARVWATLRARCRRSSTAVSTLSRALGQARTHVTHVQKELKGLWGKKGT